MDNTSNQAHSQEEAAQMIQMQRETQTAIAGLLAPEDEGLRHALTAAQQAGLPQIQISPMQGRLLQVCAAACNAQRILEIGSLAGYSGIWLARMLPTNGRLITLEVNPEHAAVVRNAFEHAGVNDRAEVRVGNALDLLPQLVTEGPFDLVFIDADKSPYPQYLEWALRLSRPGSFIIADNCIRQGKGLREPGDEYTAGIVEYNKRIANDPRLVSILLPMDDDYTDGFAISTVRF